MLSPISLLLLFAVAVLTGCPDRPADPWSDTDTGFPLAAYHSDCAPWDGPALSIYLTHEALTEPHKAPYPHVLISVYRAPVRLGGSTVEWVGTDQDVGYAAWYSTPEDRSVPNQVRIRFGEHQPEGRLVGEVYLEFARGELVAGTFDAVLVPFQPLCG